MLSNYYYYKFNTLWHNPNQTSASINTLTIKYKERAIYKTAYNICFSLTYLYWRKKMLSNVEIDKPTMSQNVVATAR